MEVPPLRQQTTIPPPRKTGGAEDISRELHEARAELESARIKGWDQAQQIVTLQEALHEQEQQMTQRFAGVVLELEQKIAAEKARSRQSWKMGCEHLAEQDAIITAKDEEI